MNLYIRPGLWIRTKERVKGALDLRKFIREILKELNVPAFDQCCSNVNAGQPVRFSGGKIQYFNGTAWTDVPTGG